MKTTIALVVFLLAISAAPARAAINEKTLAQFQTGITTQEDVIRALGKPNVEGHFDDDRRQIAYVTQSRWSLLRPSVVREFHVANKTIYGSTGEAIVILFTFDSSGKLASINRQQTEADAPTAAEITGATMQNAIEEQRSAARYEREKFVGAERQLCIESRAYKLYNAQESIVLAVRNKQDAQRQLQHEQRVAEVSGAVDLRTTHTLGELIVRAEDEIQAAWTEYKDAGGTAAAPESVTHLAGDPCKSLRH